LPPALAWLNLVRDLVSRIDIAAFCRQEGEVVVLLVDGKYLSFATHLIELKPDKESEIPPRRFRIFVGHVSSDTGGGKQPNCRRLFPGREELLLLLGDRFADTEHE
jgi:hypothetical protein